LRDKPWRDKAEREARVSREKRLIDKIRVGDVVGTAPWWHNRIFNFFKLWLKRDWQYARARWKRLIPKRFYVICRRESDLYYAATARKKSGRADVKYVSLGRVGRVVFIGRHRCFETLKIQEKLNTAIGEQHYSMIAGYAPRKVRHDFFTNNLGWLNVKFVIYVMNVVGHAWNGMMKLRYYKPTALDIVEQGEFAEI
jgi:hypothetical protein